MSLFDFLAGKPLATTEERAEQIGPVAGIPVFGLDALSSAAYGPEAALAPRSARLVLQSAVQARQPVGIFEIPERSLVMTVPLLFTPIIVALVTPFIRPFRWKRLLWTYVVPLIPLTCWWDGLVSACRAYTVAEMLAMTQGFDDYDWKADRIGVRGKAGHLTHLLGIPRSSRI